LTRKEYKQHKKVNAAVDDGVSEVQPQHWNGNAHSQLGFFGFDGVAVTLATDAFVIEDSFNTVSAESGTADNLATITQTDSLANDVVRLVPHSGHTITVKHGTGNIFLLGGVDKVLDANVPMKLIHVGSSWYEEGLTNAALIDKSNTFAKGQTITPVSATALVLNLPTGPTGSASIFYGGLKVVAGTITFATTAQSNDYYTNFLDQATLVNPSAGVIPNAATLKIVGAPIASTNVTITNNYALWVSGGNSLFAGTLTSTGGITMSSADITLAGNKIKTTTYTFAESSALVTNLLIKPTSGNTRGILAISPNGSSTASDFWLFRTSDVTTNYELFHISTDSLVTGEFAITSEKGGSGTIRPINIYMATTKLLSFDTANTITSNVNTIMGVGGNTFLYINGNNNTLYPSSSTGVGAIGWNFQSSAIDFWNTFTSATDSFIFRQLTGASAQTTLMTLSSGGLITRYGTIATAGIGLVPVYGSTSQKSETGADTNVLTYTPPAVAGTYRIRVAISVSAANTATLGFTATWKDSNGHAQAPTNLALTKGGTAAPALTFSAAANDVYYADFQIEVDNSATAIVIKTTFSGTSIAYKISATIEQLQ